MNDILDCGRFRVLCSRSNRLRLDMTVETLLTDSDDDILAITFDDLGIRNHEAVGVGVGALNAWTSAPTRLACSLSMIQSL